MRLRVFVVIAVLAATGLSIGAALVETFPGDQAITTSFQTADATWFEKTMRTVTGFGGTVPMLSVLALGTIILSARSYRHYALGLPGLAIGLALVPFLKELVDRPRPTVDLVSVLSNVGGHSFPSGHAFMSMTVLGAIFYLAGYICGPSKLAVYALRTVLVLGILGIGASRVYLGVHWTSDIVGGYLMGGLLLFAAIQLFNTHMKPQHRSWLAM